MTGTLVKRGNLDTDMCTRTASWEDWKHAARSKELVEARREACSRPFPVPSEGALYLDFGLPASRAGDNTSAPQSVVLCLDSLSDIIQCPRVVFSARMGMMWRAAVQDRDQTDIHCGRDCSHRCTGREGRRATAGIRERHYKINQAEAQFWSETANNQREMKNCIIWPEGHQGSCSHGASERTI